MRKDTSSVTPGMGGGLGAGASGGGVVADAKAASAASREPMGGRFLLGVLAMAVLPFDRSRLSSHEADDLLGALSSSGDDQGLENAPGLSAGGELFGFSRSRARAFGLGLLSHSGCFLRSSISRSTKFVTLRAAPVIKCLDMCEPSRVACAV